MIINRNNLDEYLHRINPNKCALCGHNEWTVSDVVFYSQELTPSKEGGSIVIGEPSKYMPFIAISCKYCGNTHIINTLAAGIHDFREEDKQEESK